MSFKIHFAELLSEDCQTATTTCAYEVPAEYASAYQDFRDHSPGTAGPVLSQMFWSCTRGPSHRAYQSHSYITSEEQSAMNGHLRSIRPSRLHRPDQLLQHMLYC